METEENKAQLLSLGYPERSVKQLIKKENNTEMKQPLFALTLENNDK